MLKCFIILTLYKHYTFVIQILTLLGTIKNHENFNLHVTGQCLKKSTLNLLKFLFVELEYIYLAHICFLKACMPAVICRAHPCHV